MQPCLAGLAPKLFLKRTGGIPFYNIGTMEKAENNQLACGFTAGF